MCDLYSNSKYKPENKIKELYPEFFKKDYQYYFAPHGDKVVILEPVDGTITNIKRTTVKYKLCALLRGNKFLVRKIIPRFSPNMHCKKTPQDFYFECDYLFTENEIVEIPDYDMDLEKVNKTTGIYCYASLEPAFYRNRPNIRFNGGRWYTYYDNGLIKSIVDYSSTHDTFTGGAVIAVLDNRHYKNGWFIEYYDTGLIKKTGEYKNDTLVELTLYEDEKKNSDLETIEEVECTKCRRKINKIKEDEEMLNVPNLHIETCCYYCGEETRYSMLTTMLAGNITDMESDIRPYTSKKPSKRKHKIFKYLTNLFK